MSFSGKSAEGYIFAVLDEQVTDLPAEGEGQHGSQVFVTNWCEGEVERSEGQASGQVDRNECAALPEI